MIENYYKLFNISSDASDKEIKAAYRTLVKMHHPDKSNDENAAEKFQNIQTAYEILSNPYSRLIYNNVLEQEKNQKAQNSESRQKPKKKNQNIIKRIINNPFHLIFILLLNILLGYYLYQFKFRWEKTNGKYLQHTFLFDKYDNEVLNYYMNVQYYYQVSGRRHIASHTIKSNNYEKVKNFEPKYNIDVYYNTQNHKINQLTLPKRSKEKISILCLITFYLIEIIFLIFKINEKTFNLKKNHKKKYAK